MEKRKSRKLNRHKYENKHIGIYVKINRKLFIKCKKKAIDNKITFAFFVYKALNYYLDFLRKKSSENGKNKNENKNDMEW